jgi:hypothetical protein
VLDRRNLPKTGNVDELIERLVEADSQQQASPSHRPVDAAARSVVRVIGRDL